MPSKDVFPKFAAGKLHSGSSSGPVVRNRSQAVAIAASERDKEKQNGGAYPESTHPAMNLKNRKRKGA
jgi:hypothetical protein